MSLFKKHRDHENDAFDLIDFSYENRESTEKPTSPDVLTPEEITDFEKPQASFSNKGALESLKKRIEQNAKSNAETEKSSLLDKCMPYIIDEDGKDASDDGEPLYKLQSVAEILKSESENALKRLSKQYGMVFEELELGRKDEFASKEAKHKRTDTVKSQETDEQKPQAKPQAKSPQKENFSNIQSNVPIVISDIDVIPEKSYKPPKASENTATITFTPVMKADNVTSEIKISTHTKPIDLTDELVKLPKEVQEQREEEHRLEKDDFEEYTPSFEIKSEKDAAKYRRVLSIKKRNSFLQTFFSFFLTILLALAKLPVFSTFILSHTAVAMTVCASVTGITALLNISMFRSILRVFKKKYSPDILACFATVLTGTYAVMGIICGDSVLDLLLTLNMILSFRALRKFLKYSYMLSNLSLAFSTRDKNAVKLISDPAITFAMAKNSVEGDVLIAAPKKTEGISDFVKYSNYGKFLDGKYPIFIIISLILTLISGLASGVFFDGIFYGFYAAAAIQCICSLPFSFMVDILPLYRTSRVLKKYGAAILGKAGARKTELANAMVINSADIFPEGTVSLHNMQILNENELDDTIIRAAALSDYMSSPLAPIFKSIVKTGNITALPDTDTVKYEDTLGISGWVDNRLLFIGNRTLMESHGIAVPSVETDYKILRSGYFPVYVATPEKVCALLTVKYTAKPNISKELKRVTGLGITLLVNNTDPNLTEQMICDYLGLYDDSVKVMSAVGSHMYTSSVTSAIIGPAPAVYKGNGISLAAILNCANKIKRSNTLLTAVYIIFAIIGSAVFTYASFGGSGNMLSTASILLYSLASTVISYLLYITERP